MIGQRRDRVGFVMSVNVASLRQVQEVLKTLPDDLSKKALRSAMRGAAKIIKQQAQRLAPVDANPKNPDRGFLRKSIGYSGERSRDRTEIKAVVRAYAPHAHLVEFGTPPRWQQYKDKKKKIPLKEPRYTGAAQPYPFMFKAAQQKVDEAARSLAGNIRKYLDNRNKRIARGTAR